MSEGVHSEDAPVAVSGGPVTLTRTVERKSSGVTATYDLSTEDEAVGVRVRDDLPAGLGGDDVGFHPEFSPHVSEFEGDEVTFEAIVRPETSTTVVLGVVAADAGFETVPVIEAVVPVSPSTIDEGVSLFPEEDESGFFGGIRQALGGTAPEAEHPTNEVVTDPVETPDEGSLIVEAEPEVEPDGAEADGSGVTVVPDEVEEANDSPDADAKDETETGRGEGAASDAESDENTEAETSAETDAETDADAEADTDVDTHTETVDDAESTEDEATDSSLSDLPDEDDAEPVADEEVPVSASSEVNEEASGDESNETEAAPDTEPAESEAADPDTDTAAADVSDADAEAAETESVDAGTEEDSDSVVARLVAELEAGDISESDREALRAAILEDNADEAADADDEADAESGTASLGVRLDHLQSRVEQFGAYANALEDVIDDYGAADGFVRETEDSLEELEAHVGSLRSQIASLEERDDLASTDELESVEESLADLHADVVDDRESREEFEAQFDRRVSRVEDDLGALASDVREGQDDIRADVRALRADVRELRTEVEDVAAMRENLAAALGGSPREE
ncbi:hypothetical protein [Halarchaeum sp. P4]|uniref:hypothetical protein n=1 Tax=Halarchaeum sp. P4 TaxID=3421639 RepID=UPI003EBB7079